MKIKQVLLCLALVLGFATHGFAATITAASTSQSDVQAAINAANEGDTVVVPAGDSTWPGSAVTWTGGVTVLKAITLQGQGIDKTFIRRDPATCAPENWLINIAPSNPNVLCRVTGFYLDWMRPCPDSGGNKRGIIVNGPSTKIRIDHCFFNFGRRPMDVGPSGYPIFGVIDHCGFYNCNVWLSLAYHADSGKASWSQPIRLGGLDAFVIEDCSFTADGNASFELNEIMLGGQGTRNVFRHNTVNFESSYPYPANLFDAHGHGGYGHYGFGEGTRLYEIYNNNITVSPQSYRYANFRGGTIIMHDNTFTASPAKSVVIGLTAEQVLTDDQSHGMPYQIESIMNSFFWNNINSGDGSPVIAVGLGTHTNEPRSDQDYFNRSIQPGDIWYPYTPLVYPHPLVSEH